MKRITSACLLMGASALSVTGSLAWAQEFPSRPVQLLISFPPGNVVDVTARAFAQVVENALAQRVLPVNRPGGTMTIAMTAVSNAPADGYTWVYTPVTPISIQPHRVKVPYTLDSFIPVCQTFENIFYLAVSSDKSPHKSLKDLLDHARANPGRVKYMTVGVGSSPHLAGAELFRRAGVEAVDVPFQGSDAASVGMVQNGELDSGVLTTVSVATMKLRPLAVFAPERQKHFPDAPTVGELGFPVLPSGYGGIFIRAGTPAPVVAKIEEACRKAVNDPLYKDIVEKQYQSSTYLDRAAFTARTEADFKAKEQLIPTLKLPAN